jgi:DNA-binding response OmpR family regulator
VTSDVHIVVIDYAMPNKNGAQIAHRMRELKPNVPILMLSGQATCPADAVGEIDRFVRKGTGSEKLLGQLNTLLSQRLEPDKEFGEVTDDRKRA